MERKRIYLVLLLFVAILFFACARTPVEVAPPPATAELQPVEKEQIPPQACPEEPTAALSIIEEKKEEVSAEAESPTEESLEVEPDITFVEPKKLEPRVAYVEPTLKILILKEAESIRLKSEDALSLSFDGKTLKLEPGRQLGFRPRSTRVGVKLFPVGVATFRGTEYEQAMECAENWKHDRYTVRVIKAGGPFVHADGSVADTTEYWVALGSFKKERDAERFRDKLSGWGYPAWVIDESILNPKGNIEINNSNGDALAYADSHVSLVAEKSIEIENVPFGEGFWKSGTCEDRCYTSPLEIFVDNQGTLSVINLVSLEEYVKGIVPVEIRLKAPDEALKAQAISARTEALAKLGIKHLFDPYDFCASQHCQEFGGLARRTDRTDAAVDATRGLVLMNDGELVDAVYSANCGGHTENNDNVWSSKPQDTLRGCSDLYTNPDSYEAPLRESELSRWLKTVPAAYCADPRAGSPKNFRWREVFTAKEMTALVNKYQNVGSVKDIRVLKRGVSGRALRVKVVGTRGSYVIYKELQIRRILGKLKSTMFVIEVMHDKKGTPTTFVFRGGGWGHGVGLCQAGAEGMALRGHTCEAILTHYFSGAEIEQLYK